MWNSICLLPLSDIFQHASLIIVSGSLKSLESLKLVLYSVQMPGKHKNHLCFGLVGAKMFSLGFRTSNDRSTHVRSCSINRKNWKRESIREMSSYRWKKKKNKKPHPHSKTHQLYLSRWFVRQLREGKGACVSILWNWSTLAFPSVLSFTSLSATAAPLSSTVSLCFCNVGSVCMRVHFLLCESFPHSLFFCSCSLLALHPSTPPPGEPANAD